MPTPGVLEPLDVAKDICTSFISGFVPGAKYSFNLQRREEALNRRIVPALATVTHAAGNPLIGQQAQGEPLYPNAPLKTRNLARNR